MSLCPDHNNWPRGGQRLQHCEQSDLRDWEFSVIEPIWWRGTRKHEVPGTLGRLPMASQGQHGQTWGQQEETAKNGGQKDKGLKVSLRLC